MKTVDEIEAEAEAELAAMEARRAPREARQARSRKSDGAGEARSVSEQSDSQSKSKAGAEANCSQLIFERASDVRPEAVTWLWTGRLARGKQTLIAGDPGTGKSQFSVYVTAMVTAGGTWPCGEGTAPKGSVIILSAEDGTADTIVPRLMAAGADRSKVYIV